MGSGGPRGLQIRRRRGQAGTGRFDSDTLPPTAPAPRTPFRPGGLPTRRTRRGEARTSSFGAAARRMRPGSPASRGSVNSAPVFVNGGGAASLRLPHASAGSKGELGQAGGRKKRTGATGARGSERFVPDVPAGRVERASGQGHHVVDRPRRVRGSPGSERVGKDDAVEPSRPARPARLGDRAGRGPGRGVAFGERAVGPAAGQVRVRFPDVQPDPGPLRGRECRLPDGDRQSPRGGAPGASEAAPREGSGSGSR
jgi:hypothetical protein